MPGQTTDVKDIITKARAQNIPDSATMSYLQNKGLVDASGKPLPQFGNANVPKAGFANPLTTMDPTGAQGKAAIQGALPLAGSIGGAALGGIGGAAVGGPVGAYLGAVGGSAAGGAAGNAVSQVIGNTANLGDVGKAAVGYGAAEAIGGPVASVVGKGLEAAGAGLAKAFIPKSDAESAALRVYKSGFGSFFDRMGQLLTGTAKKAPTTAADTAFNLGIKGTEGSMGVQATRAQKTLWNGLISPALDQAPGTVNMMSFFKKAGSKIAADTPDPTRRVALTDALESIKQDFLSQEKNTGMVPWKKFQEYKEGWATWVPKRHTKEKI